MKRALLVKLGAIGDVVMAIPAAKQLHELGFAVDWVANAAAASVLACYDFPRVIVADERAILSGGLAARARALGDVWKQLGTAHYHLAATLYYDRRYRLLSLPVRSDVHLRLHKSDRALELHPGRHHTDEFARILLSAARGTPADAGPQPASLAPVAPDRLPASPLPASGGRRVVLAPGGARNLHRDDRLRRWATENYAELARLLRRQGCEIVLTGGPDDTWVRDSFAGVEHTDRIDALRLPELMALFDESDVVVTHDSGPLHLAGVTRCALLGIFGPVNPWSRLPRRPGAVALWGGEGFACRPCYDGSGYADCADNACMAQITPEMACATVLELLQRKREGRLSPASVRLPEPAPSLVTLGAA